MALPYTFANLTTAQLSYLDANFAALGALTPIPCAVSGTNTITLTPLTNTPTVVSYADYGLFTGVVVSTNTGAVTAQVNSLAALPVYKDTATGPVVLTGGELVAKNVVKLVYDAALNSGAGGFHLEIIPAVLGVTGSPTTGQIAVWAAGGTLAGVGTTGSGNVVLATGAAIAAATFQTTTSYTVATLPAASSGLRGSRAYVTDASVSTASVGGAITGGGANSMPVFCNGIAWVYG